MTSKPISSIKPSTRQNLSWLDRLFQKQLLLKLAQLEESELIFEDAVSSVKLGQPASQADQQLNAKVLIHDPDFYPRVALGGSVGAGEAYMDGLWDCDDLTTLIRILVRNRNVLDEMESGLARFSLPALKWLHHRNKNTKKGSRKNIAAHYDLGNEFFELFLDENMMYSSAAYRDNEHTLEHASDHKLLRICQKLQLCPDDHVLEIGTGWGGFAIFAAQNYGCRVTTTTISKEQYQLAQSRIKQAGLEDKIELLLEDYRNLDGQFDKLVSIEMIEAIGHQFINTYFRTCSERLRPNGMMLLQAITIEDQRYEQAIKSIDFIKKFIFPGSFIPCISAITKSVAESTDMRLFHLEDIGLSYARTLHEWRQRFESKLELVRAQGYPERFIRMWRFYLCYCEGGFLERSISDIQVLFTKPRNQRQEILPELGHQL